MFHVDSRAVWPAVVVYANTAPRRLRQETQSTVLFSYMGSSVPSWTGFQVVSEDLSQRPHSGMESSARAGPFLGLSPFSPFCPLCFGSGDFTIGLGLIL